MNNLLIHRKLCNAIFIISLLLISTTATAAICPIYEDAKSRYFSKSELTGCTCGELELLRNEIYARHGRIFNRSELQTFFSRQTWYKKGVPDSSGIKGQNKFEQKNVLAIKNQEDSRNCKAGPGKSEGSYSAPATGEDREILEVARKYVNANSSDVKYKLKIIKKLKLYALVDVIPLQELDPHMVILEKVGGKWIALEMGTLLDDWQEKVPELFK